MKLFSDSPNTKAENAQTYKALIITLTGNLILAVMKLIASHISESSGLRADALNSLSDVLYSTMLVIGMFIALRPPDISHPQGHRRFEPLVGVVISFSIAWAGYQALSGSIDKIQNGPQPLEMGLPVIVLMISALIKAAMYLVIRRIAKQVNSPTLKIAAMDNVMDTVTSFTAILGVIASRYINLLADPIAGILVSLWIFRAAFLALLENLGFLTGAGAPEETRQEFISLISGVPGVANVHQLCTEYVGTRYLLDVHINVDGKTSLHEVHRIESEVVKKLLEHPDVERAYVHVEPIGYD